METRSDISQQAFSEESEKAWLALLLCWVAGFADAFGYLTLNHLFSSHISGNTTAAGASAGQANWTDAAQRAFPILCFLIGFSFGVIFEIVARRLQIRRRFSIALIIEAALILTFLLFGHNCEHFNSIAVEAPFEFYFLIALLAIAMGLQNASLSRVRRQSVHTTYVTGMLTQSIESTVKVLFQAYDRWHKRSPETSSDELLRAVFYGGLWLLFFIGAVCGGFGEKYWKFDCLFVPLAILVFIILCDIVRPVHD